MWNTQVFAYLEDENVNYLSMPGYGGPTIFYRISIPGVLD